MRRCCLVIHQARDQLVGCHLAFCVGQLVINHAHLDRLLAPLLSAALAWNKLTEEGLIWQERLNSQLLICAAAPQQLRTTGKC